MNPNYTHTSILLDASGSMHTIKLDTIGGFNDFINEQKKEPGKMTITLAQFSSSGTYNIINEISDIASIEPLSETSYQTSGSTALLDAVSRLIKETGEKLASMPEDERPAKVVISIITDGEENDSKETTKAQLAEMIKHQEDVYNWNFSYVGANQDSFAEAGSFGVASNTANFTADTLGVKKVWKGMSRSYATYRSAISTESYSLNQDDVDNADVK